MPDGIELAVRERGAGRAVILVHGFLSDGVANWFETGIADVLVGAGRRVIAPDLRGHGASDAPIGARFWPPDILVSDLLFLLDRLGAEAFDLVGYSLGARTAARMMIRGARPGRAVLGGLGDTGVMEAGPRADFFRAALQPQGPWPTGAEALRAHVRRRGLDARAMIGVLDSFAPTTAADLAAVTTPCRVVMGAEDHENGSASRLAQRLGHASAVLIPGDHLAAIRSPAFARETVQFLSGAPGSAA